MKKRFIAAFAICLIWLSASCFCSAAGTVTTVISLMNVLKQETKSSVYNIGLNAPFSKESSGIKEGVSTETGALTVSNSILSIPGRNGMNLNLNLMYNNLSAKLYDEGTTSASITNSYGTTIIAYYDVYDNNGYWLRT
ncbi:hypothetical protein SDC9_53926 [bioreactor metagenome]|uniref:Uncharacterized protein n=1 Tax=bioreactor metagenome TaxID=1076179 RepID=A0A644WUR0_9ZZZZ